MIFIQIACLNSILTINQFNILYNSVCVYIFNPVKIGTTENIIIMYLISIFSIFIFYFLGMFSLSSFICHFYNGGCLSSIIFLFNNSCFKKNNIISINASIAQILIPLLSL